MAGGLKKYYLPNRILFGLTLLVVLAACKKEDMGPPLSLELFRRSVLDQKPRMITLKFSGDQYLAYDLQHMVPYKLWSGGVLWNGAVFNQVKTIQPSSYGDAYWQLQDGSLYWRLLEDGQDVPFQLQYKSYDILDDHQLLFHYDIKQNDDIISISELPRLFEIDDSVIYSREFTVKGLHKNLAILADNNPVSNGSVYRKSFQRMAPPARPVEVTSENGAQYWLDRSGCTTCHQLAEKNIGPSYQEIADKYELSDESIAQLIESVKIGSTGKWGEAQMIPHPNLADADIRNMVRYILSLKSGKPIVSAVSREEPMETRVLKPGFGSALQGVHPSFDLIKIRPPDFKPRVGGMAMTAHGDLLISTWDSIGAVYLVSGIEKNNPEELSIDRIATGLSEPLGLTTVGDDIFVLQKHELTQLIDKDGDGVTDRYLCINNQFGVTPDFHEFSYGLIHHDGKFYGGLGLAMRLMSSELQHEDRGTVFSINADQQFEILARGLRQPNGIGLGPEDEIFVTENQGQWVPACKLIQVKRNQFYGCQFGTGDRFKDQVETLPAVYLPQDEIGNSPGQPILLKQGPYAGQMIFGDVTHGGIKRAYLEKVNEDYQGCVFRFTQGMEAGINRLAIGSDGSIYAGGVGMNGGWAHHEHQFGLEKLQYNGKSAFEMKAVKIKGNGFEIEFTNPVSRQQNFDRSKIKCSQWRYESTPRYGGPKIDEQELAITSLVLSDDRKNLQVVMPEVKQGYVVYFLLDESLVDDQGQALWSGEAWYTVKNLARE
jgi:cytochrome c